uniref:Uncharacterized protein n=1 Tax=Cajanus cajan TaxID=3821 RepID=A0A151RSP5_CAJCA|nr:hypothetical protein KK1_032914 [Cajanus cajan]
MKELLTKRRRILEEEIVEIEAGCSAIIQKSLPQKSRDPGSFILHVSIGNLLVGKALLDLAASINLMPLPMLKKIGEVEVRPTRMTLQLADRSIKLPHGIAEDMIMKVDKFMFPVDFVVMDMEEDVEVPLILGRPFMKTARVIIDMDDGKLKVRVQDEEVSFNVFETTKFPKGNKDCFRIDVLDDVYLETQNDFKSSSPLEKALPISNEELEKVIGKACHLPVGLEHKAFWALKALNYDLKAAGEKRKLQLHEWEERRLKAYESSKSYKHKAKIYHDRKILNRNFQPGQQVLLFNSRLKLFPGKLKSKWSGPFSIKSVKSYGAIELEDPASGRTWLVNGQRLKHYLGGEVERFTASTHLKEP